jgi:transposase-like protein
MPWEQSLPMDQRTQFVTEYLRDTITFSELCDRYGISRKTGYKWINRYQAEGPAGLAERSRQPHHGLWDVYLGPVKLGRLLEETMRIEDHLGKLKRK